MPTRRAPANENFYAIENFFYTAEFFHFLRVAPPATFPEELASSGRQYCGLEWREVRDMHPKVDHDELAKYCFALAFMDRWFKVGLALHAPHKNVQIVVCCGESDVGAVILCARACFCLFLSCVQVQRRQSSTADS